MRLIDRWRLWRLRPGILLAAKLAEQSAWRHPNAGIFEPEVNLLRFSLSLHERLATVEEGDITGLCLDPGPSPDPVSRRRGG